MSIGIGGIGGYVITFSLAGLLLYALQLLPNIIWLAIPPANNVLKHNSSPHAVLNLVEQVFGIATVALLIIVINRPGTEGRNSAWLLISAVVFLAGYYAAWGAAWGCVLRRQCLALVTRIRHRRHVAPLLFLRGELDEGFSRAS